MNAVSPAEPDWNSRVAFVHRFSAVAPGAPFVAGSVVVPTCPRHKLDHIEIIAFTRGRGRLRVWRRAGGERDFALEPGSMFLIRPEDQFGFWNFDDGLVATYVSFTVPEWRLFATLVGIGTSWATSIEPPAITFDPADPRVIEPFEEAERRFGHGPTSMDLVRFWTQVVPLLFPQSASSRTESATPPAWLTRGLEAMEDEVNLRAGLPRLAALCHVSPSHLAASTRRYLGTTPRALLMDLRLERAAHLLETTGDSVAAIGMRCGFDDPSYFGVSFRRRYQLSPREYRQVAVPVSG
jgi:AraC-like DNA-binding protein